MIRYPKLAKDVYMNTKIYPNAPDEKVAKTQIKNLLIQNRNVWIKATLLWYSKSLYKVPNLLIKYGSLRLSNFYCKYQTIKIGTIVSRIILKKFVQEIEPWGVNISKTVNHAGIYVWRVLLKILDHINLSFSFSMFYWFLTNFLRPIKATISIEKSMSEIKTSSSCIIMLKCLVNHSFT